MAKIYSTKKVFYPRLAPQAVWISFCSQLCYSERVGKYFDWTFSDVMEEPDEMSLASKWLLDNGAKIDDNVLLDMG